MSGFLGVSLFLFGVLKFVDPFKGWYFAQISNSGLGKVSYIMGILGELLVGAAFILLLMFQTKVSARYFLLVVFIASTAVIFMMLTAVYVHFQPNVPADVLPLKIKPPVIPGFFLILALTNIYLSLKQYGETK